MDDLNYGQDPQGRARFYGIYSARVVNITDPLKKNRSQVQINQPTGLEITGWAVPCLPITSNSNHPDHNEHTAAQVAALLTTRTSYTSPTSDSVLDGSHNHTIPPLVVVPKTNPGTLKHSHKLAANTTERWNDSQETNTTPEHTPHRLVPREKQLVWIMFIAGDPEYPVWIGVQE